ncbi:MAG: GGDEF domain-containing protein, partial [Gallionellaceae bacterium]|nr:GGDEF domain-containing protein [Gallionellaceae bacterium]
MAALTAPSDIARETLKTLVTRKLAPTPDNYARVYQEISGVPVAAPEAAAPAAQAAASGEAKPVLLWSKLIRDLLKQLETPHKGITITRKKEGLETVLNKFAGNPDALHEKLQALMSSWASSPTAANPADMALMAPEAAASQAAPGAPQSVIKNIEIAVQLRELLAQALEGFVSTQPDLAEEIRALSGLTRTAGDEGQVAKVAKQMRQLLIKLELRNEDREKIQEGVVRLLRLLVDNISELSSDEKWLHGQTQTLKEIISRPMDKRSVADAERNLRNAIIEQGYLKESLNDAKATLKELMATFIDRLGSMTESTGAYHTKVAGYSEKIAGAGNIAALSQILDEIMLETRTIRDDALRSHKELVAARKKAQEAEERVRELEQKLEQTSELVHADQLTGALNRRGMEETLEREIK